MGLGTSELSFSLSTGKLGIGTTTPGGALGVAGNVGIGFSFANAAPPVNGLVVQGNVGIGQTDVGANLVVAGNVGIGWTGVNASMPSLGLSVFGNVGIGTTSPISRLNVNGGSTALTADLVTLDSGSGGVNTSGVNALQLNYIGGNGSNVEAGAERISLTPGTGSGSIWNGLRIFGSTVAPISGVTLNGIKLEGASSISSGTQNAIYINANWNNAIVTQPNAGNVGIGTTAPLQRFQVNDTGSNPFVITSGGNVGIGLTNPLTARLAILGGNVGIGTTNPLAALNIIGSIGVGYTAPGSTFPANGLAVSGNIGIGTTSVGANLVVAGNVGIGWTGVNASMPSLGLSVFGNVGIGTTSPNNALQLIGGEVIGINYGISTAPTNGLLVQGNVGVGTSITTQLFQVNAGSSALTVSSSGNLGIGATTANSKLYINGGASIGSQYNTAGPTNGLIVQGNVGIGTSVTASAFLTVAGNVNIGWTGVNPTITGLGLSVKGNVGIGTTSPRGLLEVSTNGAQSNVYAAFIDGAVGIGLTTPANGSINPNTSYILDVNGKIRSQGFRGACMNSATHINSGNCNQDVAEIYQSSENVEPGDVLVADLTGDKLVKKSNGAYDKAIIGVVSTSPGLLLGINGQDVALGGETGEYSASADPKLPAVALSGKVPIKVSTENGLIKVGDYLTSSSTPGVAMRATKAGSVIGKALESYQPAAASCQLSTDGCIGKITVFMGVGYFNGISVSDLLLSNEAPIMIEDTSAAILEKLLSLKYQQTNQKLSEVLTDRVTAGLEVITPKITAQTLEVTEIKAVTINADKIRANQIEGLSVLTDELVTSKITSKLDVLGAQIASQSAQTINLDILLAQSSASAKLASKFDVNEDPIRILTGLKVEKGVEVSLDMKVVGKLTAEGGLIISGPAEFASTTSFKGNVIFQTIAEFIGNVIFRGDINFEGRPVFNKDTAGFALIQKGADSVEVVFEKEYAATPLVNISITLDNLVDQNTSGSTQLLEEASQSALERQILDGDIRYIVTRRTTKGFSIKLNKAAPSDLKFSWSALAVKDVKTAVSLQSTVNSLQSTVSVLGVQTTSTTSATLNLSPPAETSASGVPKQTTIKINSNELGFLRVREDATTSSTEVGQVLPGQTFQILVEKNGWYEIEYKQDFYGWVNSSYVTLQ